MFSSATAQFLRSVKPLGQWLASGKPFRAVERLGARYLHPEQILTSSEQGSELYNFTNQLAHKFRLQEHAYHKMARELFKKHHITTDAEKDAFFTLLEFPTYAKRYPTAEEVLQFPTNVRQAVREHLSGITDPIWQQAKALDPEIGYIPGYFTHYISRSIKHTLEAELKRLEKDIRTFKATKDRVAESMSASLEAQAEAIKSRLSKLNRLPELSHLDELLTAERYGSLPKGGHYGAMDETRKVMQKLGMPRLYEDIMHDYISNAHRKMFLDAYMPEVKKFFDPRSPSYIADDWLRTYAFDYVQAQRGALGAKSRVALNAALKELFPTAKHDLLFSKSVDFVTRLNYLSKIGLSARFPIVNMTQPLLTLYPLVGAKVFLKSYQKALTDPKTWQLADKAGIIFEPAVRRATSEFFGYASKYRPVEEIFGTMMTPATATEKLNRVVSFVAGLEKGKQLGLKGDSLFNYAVKMVDDTQFRYYKEAMPLFMSQNPLGRVIFQFRTFTVNYANFLTKLIRNAEKDPEGKQKLLRAIASLSVLSGTSAFPMWDWVRNKLMKSTGVDFSVNPIEMVTDYLGLTPGVNLGASLEPFNYPYDLYMLLGPTIGPLAQVAFSVRDPDLLLSRLERLAMGVAPPIVAYSRLFEQKARKTTPAHPEGKVIGERPLLEKLFLRPSLEQVRKQYLNLIANALAGGHIDSAGQLIKKAQRSGVLVDADFMSQARAKATMIRRGTLPPPR